MHREPDPAPGGDARTAVVADASPLVDATEFDRLRRRLAFYEGFDELIQQNIGRSGDLLRRAAEQQAESEREIAAARAELAATRASQAAALAGLADELAQVRARLDDVAHRFDAVRRLLGGADLPAGQGAEASARAPASAAEVPTPGPGAGEAIARAHRGTEVATAPLENAPDRERDDAGSIVVHGLDGVDAARAFQTWLATRPGVRSVTPREFAGGILRLDVAAAAFPGAAAAEWPGGALDVIELGPGAAVLRRRGAAGL